MMAALNGVAGHQVVERMETLLRPLLEGDDISQEDVMQSLKIAGVNPGAKLAEAFLTITEDVMQSLKIAGVNPGAKLAEAFLTITGDLDGLREWLYNQLDVDVMDLRQSAGTSSQERLVWSPEMMEQALRLRYCDVELRAAIESAKGYTAKSQCWGELTKKLEELVHVQVDEVKLRRIFSKWQSQHRSWASGQTAARDIVAPRPTALIPVANGSEEMEVLVLASILARGGFRVTLADVNGDENHIVTLARGLEIQADDTLANCADGSFDVILVPGGVGAKALAKSTQLIHMLRKQKAADKWFGGICAGSVDVLHHFALVRGALTTHPDYADRVGDLYRDAPVVVSENCVTSQGPGTAIAMGLKVVELLRGPNVAREVARRMNYHETFLASGHLAVDWLPVDDEELRPTTATLNDAADATMSDSILLTIAREQAAAFATDSIKNPWDYFEYSVKLVLARWTALRMAMEGEWGGGDMRRKYEILLEEILHIYKYNKNVYADDMALNISEYVESEFGLVCEDGSVEEVAELMNSLAEECKKGQFDRVKQLHEQVQALIPIDLKKSKVRQADDGSNVVQADGSVVNVDEAMAAADEPLIDEDGFTTVRRSTRRRAAPKVFDPSAQFPGAQ
ncbi:hypothetical protein P43SY_007644 [Pythium insidiosum]|uniref:DJ-1/PfpI domain-containing protein n=1 Tax=Pythium insidiosum TaxID=114742 RepID=A0AAD5M3D7_PYTIN|nr:hypothetical protein P43SY_007644 [Pythium insidiosum]